MTVHPTPTTIPQIFFAFPLAKHPMVRVHEHCASFVCPSSMFLSFVFNLLYIRYLSSTLHATRSTHLDLIIIRKAEECVLLLICFYDCKILGLPNSVAEMFRCSDWPISLVNKIKLFFVPRISIG
jgi:hypothetical protein